MLSPKKLFLLHVALVPIFYHSNRKVMNTPILNVGAVTQEHGDPERDSKGEKEHQHFLLLIPDLPGHGRATATAVSCFSHRAFPAVMDGIPSSPDSNYSFLPLRRFSWVLRTADTPGASSFLPFRHSAILLEMYLQ